MKRFPVGWDRALRSVAGAMLLVLVVVFVAGNFVVVDVRLLGLSLETRVAWVAVVPGALGFAVGLLWSASRRRSHDEDDGSAHSLRRGGRDDRAGAAQAVPRRR